MRAGQGRSFLRLCASKARVHGVSVAHNSVRLSGSRPTPGEGIAEDVDFRVLHVVVAVLWTADKSRHLHVNVIMRSPEAHRGYGRDLLDVDGKSPSAGWCADAR